ncbi:hypothetical protein EBU71_20140 [bacterium]|nr:hypothetical protein [Candidatus Elulimicrobium humile]
MNLAIGVLLDNKETPVVAVVSPLSYHNLPIFLTIVILVPAAATSVSLTKGVMDLMLNQLIRLVTLLMLQERIWVTSDFLRVLLKN